MTYKTLDGYELNQGEECFISLQCLTGEHSVSTKPRPALYMDKYAKQMGWDFTTIRRMKVNCDDGCACEVIGVWKNNPNNSEVKDGK
jgi:hypothetical protein